MQFSPEFNAQNVPRQFLLPSVPETCYLGKRDFFQHVKILHYFGGLKTIEHYIPENTKEECFTTLVLKLDSHFCSPYFAWAYIGNKVWIFGFALHVFEPESTLYNPKPGRNWLYLNHHKNVFNLITFSSKNGWHPHSKIIQCKVAIIFYLGSSEPKFVIIFNTFWKVQQIYIHTEKLFTSMLLQTSRIQKFAKNVSFCWCNSNLSFGSNQKVSDLTYDTDWHLLALRQKETLKF